jgi:hypothetical protein
MGIQGIKEDDIVNRINSSQRLYQHDEPIIFDSVGRYLVYDSMQFALKNRPSTTNTVLTAAAYYFAYQ